jgi:hypothetical protein
LITLGGVNEVVLIVNLAVYEHSFQKQKEKYFYVSYIIVGKTEQGSASPSMYLDQ